MDSDNPLASLQAAACTYRIALGPRAGQKVLSRRSLSGSSRTWACLREPPRAHRLGPRLRQAGKLRPSEAIRADAGPGEATREGAFSANTLRLTACRAGCMVAHGEKSGLNFLYTCIRLEFEKGSYMNSPIPPGAVAWTGETPASISRTLRTGLMTFFRIMWSPHERGHGVLLLDRPMEEKGLAQLARSLQAGSPSTLR